MNKQVKNVLAALSVALLGTAAQADPIEFTFSGTADFELGEQILNDVSFTIRATAQTEKLDTLDHQGNPVSQYVDLAGSLFVDGLGEGTFTDLVGVFFNPRLEIAGFLAPVNFMPFHQVFSPLDILDVKDAALASYDMKSDLKLDNIQAVDPQQWYQVKTSFGQLTAYGFSDVSLQAKVSPVPEASSAALFALGAAMLAGTAWRRRPQR